MARDEGRSLGEIFATIMVFGLFSVISLAVVAFIWGVNHDYILFEFYKVAETFNASGQISASSFNQIDKLVGEDLIVFNYLDLFWLLSFIIFFVGSIVTSRFVKEESDITFLTASFYGVMILLFGLSIVGLITNWFAEEVLYSVMPMLVNLMPKMQFYLNNIGLISTIQFVLCLFANKINLEKLGLNRGKTEVVDKDEIL